MKNNVSVANFNVTFGKKDEPMLTYFNTIIYPAFKSGLKREYKFPLGTEGYDKYYFLDVDLVKNSDRDYVLTGKIVKETILEVKSIVVGEQLVQKNDKYPSAPYSVFYIYLRNHRMVLIKNQKGSPDIKSFGVTARYILDRYIRETNKQLKKSEAENVELLPFCRVNVVGIPMREDLEDALKKVRKMAKLKLRMYPLNGDIDLNGVIDWISNDLRELVDSKTGSISLNSPGSKKGVVDLIDASQGVFEATIDVEYEDKSTEKISNNTFSGKTTWSLTEDEMNDEKIVLPKLISLESIKLVSPSNNKIYEKNIKKIEQYIKK